MWNEENWKKTWEKKLTPEELVAAQIESDDIYALIPDEDLPIVDQGLTAVQMGDAAPAPPSPASSVLGSGPPSPARDFGSQFASLPIDPHSPEGSSGSSYFTPSPGSGKKKGSAMATGKQQSRPRGDSMGRTLSFTPSPTKVKRNTSDITSVLEKIFQSSRGRRNIRKFDWRPNKRI